MTETNRSRPDIAPRRLRAFGHRYSHFVNVMKFTLPLVALVLIGILITRLSGGSPQQISAVPQEEKTTPGQIELIGAKYEGVDDEGRPYTVTADRADRAMDAPDTVLFENPLADIILQDKTWIAVKATGGSLNIKSQQLILKDDVTAFHDSGYEIHLKDLQINLQQKTAETSSTVQAQGPMGAIAAQNMAVRDQGNLIIFGGPATMTIYKLSSSKRARG